MSRYAICDKATGIVQNIAAWDGVTPWNPGDQFIVRKLAANEAPALDFAVYDVKTDTFTDDGINKAPVTEPPALSAEQKLEALFNTLVTKGDLTQEDVDAIKKAPFIIVDGVLIDEPSTP